MGGAAGDSRNLHVAVGSAVRTIGVADDVRVEVVREADATTERRHNIRITRAFHNQEAHGLESVGVNDAQIGSLIMRALQPQQHALRAFDRILDVDEELHRLLAVHDSMVVTYRQIHHGPQDDLPRIVGIFDRAFRDLAVAEMRRDPGRVLRLAGVKLLRTWNPFPNVATYRGGWIAWISAAWTVPIVLGAGVFAVRSRRRTALQVMTWLPIAYFTLVHCVYIGSLRYRIPLMPFLELGAAAAFVRSAGEFRRETPNAGRGCDSN